MEILMTILFIVAGFIAALLVAALFVPRAYAIKREVVIDRPTEDVFNFVRHLQNQDRFSKWIMADPTLKKGIRGTDGTVGCVDYWEGKSGTSMMKRVLGRDLETSLGNLKTLLEGKSVGKPAEEVS